MLRIKTKTTSAVTVAIRRAIGRSIANSHSILELSKLVIRLYHARQPEVLMPRARGMGRLAILFTLVVLLQGCESTSPPPPRATRPDIHLAPDTRVSKGVVPRDSTLEAMLLEQGLQSEAVHNVIDA